MLAIGYSDGTATIWDEIRGSNLLTMRGVGRIVWSVAWSPDGKRVAVSGADETAKVYSLE